MKPSEGRASRSASPSRRPITAARLQALADLFQHLSDPRRLQLLLILARGEHGVCDLAEHLGVTPSAVSHQLQTLRHARLVAFRRQGKTCFYRLIDGHIEQLVSLGREHVSER
jgi:ArsR family transcriptional regulator, lead/cadmium/zinc/bismuth-responsive transcriptional repressor